MKQKVGILGGTFDPVHTSHLELAEAARKEYGLTKILFIPAAVPPHKRGSKVTSFEHRLRMLEIACESSVFFECSSIEGELPRPSYTVDTLKALQSGMGKEYTFYFIIGVDAFLDIPTWKSYREIVQLVSLIVSKREGIDEKELANLAHSLGYKNTNGSVWIGSKGSRDICFLKKTPADISSTSIRQTIRDNQITSGTIPGKVIEYIKTHNLYAIHAV